MEIIDPNYQEDLKKSSELIEPVTRAFNNSTLTREQLAESYSELIGMSQYSSKRYIGDLLRRGPDITQLSPNSRLSKPQYLNRLALLYSIMGVEEDDPLIEKTKDINPNFEYPPKENANIDIGLKTKNKKLEGIIKETEDQNPLQEIEQYDLTTKQAERLHHLAKLYTKRNQG